MIDFDQILPGDVDAAIMEYIEGQKNAAAWVELTAKSPALSAIARTYEVKARVNPQLACSIFMAGMNAGYLLRQIIEERRVVVVR